MTLGKNGIIPIQENIQKEGLFTSYIFKLCKVNLIVVLPAAICFLTIFWKTHGKCYLK